jgi:hypothetical protein
MPGGTFGLVGDYGCSSDSEGESGEDDPPAAQSATSNPVNSTEDGGDDKGTNKGTLKEKRSITQLTESVLFSGPLLFQISLYFCETQLCILFFCDFSLVSLCSIIVPKLATSFEKCVFQPLQTGCNRPGE